MSFGSIELAMLLLQILVHNFKLIISLIFQVYLNVGQTMDAMQIGNYLLQILISKHFKLSFAIMTPLFAG